ncbi:MAG: hypothetical protein OEL20_05355 [Sulfuritalea sp.]|nr:hypothetical protein [Sulfuritalea sp.]
MHSTELDRQARPGRKHAHAYQGGPPLVQRKVSPGDHDEKPPRSHRNSPVRKLDRFDLVVRDTPGWGECWAELRPRKKSTPPSSIKERHDD